jgi:sulfoxide reductase heme-binding subunit YedZ
MIALTSPFIWYTTKATGLVALLLLTTVVLMGTLVANRIGGTVVGRFELNELHRSLSIVTMLFVVLHIVSTVIDSYVSTGWIAVLVPFASSYKPLPIAIGAIAFDLLLCVWVSSLLKVRLKNDTWRFIHWFSWLAFASALLHAFVTGSDAHKPLGLIVIGGCALVGVGSALWRVLGRPKRAGGRTALSPLAPAKARTTKSQQSNQAFPTKNAPARKKRY